VRIALDSNRYCDLVAGDQEVVRAVETAEAVFLPLIALAELRAGFAAGTKQAENERVLRRFLLKGGVEVLSPDEQTTHHYAQVFTQLRRQGTPIPTNDIWIAALALQHDLVLCSRDRQFDKVAQIPRA
jgi:tRNA(fMet)-specific endonuclease VapC